MSSSYTITEAYPKPAAAFTHTGRGGAGNIARTRASTSRPSHQRNLSAASLPDGPDTYPPPPGLSTINATKSQRRKFFSGRGGFANLHTASEDAIFSFDEELEKLMHVEDTLAPVYHIGRGGEGNVVDDHHTFETQSPSDESISSMDSHFTLKESLERMWNRFGLRKR